LLLELYYMLVWHVLRRRAFSSCDLRWRLAEMRYLLAACAAADWPQLRLLPELPSRAAARSMRAWMWRCQSTPKATHSRSEETARGAKGHRHVRHGALHTHHVTRTQTHALHSRTALRVPEWESVRAVLRTATQGVGSGCTSLHRGAVLLQRSHLFSNCT
jgi:hypothetical protein